MEVSPVLQNAYWIVLAPFIAGAVIILGARASKTMSMLLSIAAVAYGFVHSLLIFNTLHGNPVPYQVNWDWFVSDSFKLSVGLLVDNLASVMLIVVTAVSLLVQIYTHGYMREDPGYSRFYSYLSLFTGSMLGLVVATNLFQMYLFWELVGVCSYFLIGFWWYKPSAAAACLKAFVVNRVGDFGFLVGILMFLAATMGFWSAHADHGLLMFTDPTGGGIDLTGAMRWALTEGSGHLTTSLLTVISLLIFTGPMAKSAQLPLHVWLPDAMEGPTPISALIHAATMVAAGVYLVARAYPLWLNWADPANPTTVDSAGLNFVAWIGTLTALMAAIIACSQYDIKRILAWSTVSQLGYMFAGLGVGAFTGGMFHLFNHAFFKAMLFLCSGAVIHALHDEQDVRNMGGLKKYMPITYWCCLIGTISISGVPGFSGFFSKDEIIGGAWDAGAKGVAWILIFTAGLTAFYMFRMLFMAFHGEYRGTVKPHHEKFGVVTAPLCALAVPSIVSGFLGTSMNFWQGQPYTTPFGNFLYFQHPHFPEINWTPVALSIGAAFIGIALAGLVYVSRTLKINDWFIENARPLYNLSFNKFYWDNIYLGLVNKLLLPFFTLSWQWVDMYIVDNLVNLNRTVVLGTSETLRLSENGRGQFYAMIIFACVAGITLFVYLTHN